MSDEILRKTAERDYTRPDDVAAATDRLVAGLQEDGDDPRMFDMLGQVLTKTPEAVMPVVVGSIELAREKLGQDRKSGSSATLLYPVDAALRVVALRRGLVGNPLSASSWNAERVEETLLAYPAEIIELAGTNTTSKNLPQRGAHILWLLDQCSLVQQGRQLAFLELGASGGFVLDGLRRPTQFRDWMEGRGYRADFAAKSDIEKQNAVLGTDLVRSSPDWLQAVILDDDLRDETNEFIQLFDRSRVVVENATDLAASENIQMFFDENADALPIIFSCFMLYQLDEATRYQVLGQARSVLQKRGGGLLIISDTAKYQGYPEYEGGCVAWVEDQDGRRVSPTIFLSRATLTEWEEIQ